jgi:hypothetical protein
VYALGSGRGLDVREVVDEAGAGWNIRIYPQGVWRVCLMWIGLDYTYQLNGSSADQKPRTPRGLPVDEIR